MNNNKYILFLLFIISTTQIGCSNKSQNSITNDYSIKDFKLEQLKANGDVHFSMISEQAFIDPINRNIDSKIIELIIFADNKPKFKVSSDKGYFNNKQNSLSLINNIKLLHIQNNSNYNLIADNLLWDLNNNQINILGNIELSYNRSKLTSKKIIYDERQEKFFITGIRKYEYYKEENKGKILELESDNAVFDNKTNQITFTSNQKKVKSVIRIDL